MNKRNLNKALSEVKRFVSAAKAAADENVGLDAFLHPPRKLPERFAAPAWI